MRRHVLLPLVTCLLSVPGAFAQTPNPLPQIRQNGAVKQLYVDGKPFVMLAGELHNSSASSPEYMKPIWGKLSGMHLNGRPSSPLSAFPRRGDSATRFHLAGTGRAYELGRAADAHRAIESRATHGKLFLTTA